MRLGKVIGDPPPEVHEQSTRTVCGSARNCALSPTGYGTKVAPRTTIGGGSKRLTCGCRTCTPPATAAVNKSRVWKVLGVERAETVMMTSTWRSRSPLCGSGSRSTPGGPEGPGPETGLSSWRWSSSALSTTVSREPCSATSWPSGQRESPKNPSPRSYGACDARVSFGFANPAGVVRLYDAA